MLAGMAFLNWFLRRSSLTWNLNFFSPVPLRLVLVLNITLAVYIHRGAPGIWYKTPDFPATVATPQTNTSDPLELHPSIISSSHPPSTSVNPATVGDGRDKTRPSLGDGRDF